MFILRENKYLRKKRYLLVVETKRGRKKKGKKKEKQKDNKNDKKKENKKGKKKETNEKEGDCKA